MSEKSSLWREIEETRPVEPAFELMAFGGGTAGFSVPEWMDENHLAKLQTVLRWGTRGRAVNVCGNMDEADPYFHGVILATDRPVGEYVYGRVKDADVTAKLTHSAHNSLLYGSALISGAVGGHGANPSKAARELWHKLSVVESSLPVSDAVYLVEALDRLLADPEADTVTVGTDLLVEHVRRAVDAREQGAVIEIIRRVIERRTAVLTVGEKGVTVKGAQALDRAHLGRYERGPADHAGKHEMQLVAVDSPLVRSVISSTHSRHMADKLKKKVLGVLERA